MEPTSTVEASFRLAGTVAVVVMCLGVLTLLWIERYWR